MQNFLEKNRYIILATLLTSIIVLIGFSFVGFYPFADKSILKVDLYHQYAPFHQELREKLLNFDNLSYSFEGGLGKEFLSQMAYYTLSPISLLILFFDTAHISEAIMLFVFIKIVLCSATFSYYLKKTFNKDGIFIAIFGVMYAFMAYITSFYWNIMWLDSIYLFPLVALGVQRLVIDGSKKTYAISLLVAIMVNFYIAFLICIFSVLYFLVVLFSNYSIKREFKIIIDRCIKFTVLSVLAGGATMLLAIPTAVALGRTQTSNVSFPPFEVYENIYQIITNHFFGAKPVVLARNEDLPNVYSGVLTMMLLPLYFFNTKFKLKEKLLFLALIIFMILASVLKQFDFLIHGNHFPANLPHRYTFIYSFIILMLAYKGLMNIKTSNIKALYISIIVYISSMVITEFILVPKLELGQAIEPIYIFLNIVIMAIYTLFIVKYKNGTMKSIVLPKLALAFTIIGVPTFIGGILYANNLFQNNIKISFSFYAICVTVIILLIILGLFIKYLIQKDKINLFTTILLLVITAEAFTSFTTGLFHSGAVNRHSYVKYVEPMKEVSKYIDENDNDANKFFRQEFNRFSAINESTMYHYNGFSTFSSLAYGDTSRLIQDLGIAATGNSYRYYDPTPLIDSMFNIKYVMAKDNKKLNAQNYELKGKFDTISLYQNKTPLSIGFMVDENIKNWDTKKDNPFDVQADFMQKAIGKSEGLFNDVKIRKFSTQDVKVKSKKGSENKYSYTLKDETNLDLIPTVKTSIINPKTQHLFIYIEAPNAKRFVYNIGGKDKNDRELSTGRSLIDLGIVEKNMVIDVEFSLNRKGAYDKTYHKKGDFKIYASGFDNEKYTELYKDLSDEMLTVYDYKSGDIKGKINAKEDGILFTSIPYDKGFNVFVNGEKSNTIKIAGDGLIGVQLSKGENDVEFKYNIVGFKIGVIISLVSIILLILYIKYGKKSLQREEIQKEIQKENKKENQKEEDKKENQEKLE